MKSLHALSLLVLASFFFVACSKETSKEVEEATDAVVQESKDNFKESKAQVSEMAAKAKVQAAETAEAVKVKTQEVVDGVAEDVKAAKDAAAEKIDVIVKETKDEVADLKAKADAKLQGMFPEKEAPADVE